MKEVLGVYINFACRERAATCMQLRECVPCYVVYEYVTIRQCVQVKSGKVCQNLIAEEHCFKTTNKFSTSVLVYHKKVNSITIFLVWP